MTSYFCRSLVFVIVPFLFSCESAPDEGEPPEEERPEEPLQEPPSTATERRRPPVEHAPERRPSGRTLRRPSRGLSPAVREIVETLQQPNASAAGEAYWKLAEIEARHIPELISLVRSTEKTSLTELRILVMDAEFQGFLASRIPGMGLMERPESGWKGYDGRLACGLAPNGKGIDTRMKKTAGFALGVVVRAALLNRFRSSRFPRGIDHTRELESWWWAYYDNVFH